MFGLTKREQRWKAEHQAAELVAGLASAVVRATADVRIAEAQRREPLSDDDIEMIASSIRPITESGQPSWEHAVARAIEKAHGIDA